MDHLTLELQRENGDREGCRRSQARNCRSALSLHAHKPCVYTTHMAFGQDIDTDISIIPQFNTDPARDATSTQIPQSRLPSTNKSSKSQDTPDGPKCMICGKVSTTQRKAGPHVCSHLGDELEENLPGKKYRCKICNTIERTCGKGSHRRPYYPGELRRILEREMNKDQTSAEPGQLSSSHLAMKGPEKGPK